MSEGASWIKFLRQYGPIPRNDNSFDEHLRRSSRRLGVRPPTFPHPLERSVLDAVRNTEGASGLIVLTGTAGDGKTHLCGKLWEAIGGQANAWTSDETYHETVASIGGRTADVVVIRDLTALPPGEVGGYASKHALLQDASRAALGEGEPRWFVIAANDGQLVESWRRLSDDRSARRVHQLIEARLVGDADPEPVDAFRFFNLSATPCPEILDLALDALLSHEGWAACYDEATVDGFFGPRCPIRRNYELLREPQLRSRLRALFELCEYAELHTPIRRVLMLLANAMLGHPAGRDRLLQAADVRGIVEAGTEGQGSIYGNLFGSNLGATKRQGLEIFDYLGRFGIGQETTNRLDNLIVFGRDDDALRPYYDAFLGSDGFYGATDRFRAAQREYLEEPSDAEGGEFLDLLSDQRRALFFKIPDEQADELSLWSLTVYTRAGEYLRDVASVAKAGGRVQRRIVARLANGLNRVFTGLLVSTDRELLLATNLATSGGGTSQLLEDRLSVAPRRHERVDIGFANGLPTLEVHLDRDVVRSLALNLTRYEFLVRVAEGALPGNFSRECLEDILAFKSSLLFALETSRPSERSDGISFRLLSLDAAGNPLDEVIEVPE